jgi:peptide/nickel transport system substrate-binding protein
VNVIAAIMPIWPAAYRERVGAEPYGKAPIGTGPYKILPITGPGEIALERFDGHYAASPKGRPAIGRITIHQVTDTATEMAELLGGRADWISDFPSDQFDNLGHMRNLQATRAEVQRVTYLNMDAAGRSGAGNPLTKEKVRQAIAHAIDRKTMAAQFMPGGSQVLDIACFRTEFGCDQSAAVRYEYDPPLAKRLLAEAGYPDGVEIDLYTYLPGIWIGAVQNYLKAVGITARTHVMQVGAVIKLAQEGKLPMALAGWGGFAVNDVSAFLGYFYGKGLFDLAHDDEIAAIVAEGGQILDAEKRRALYATAFRKITERAYFLPLFTYVKTYGFARTLDFTPFYDDNPRFYRARWR